MYMKNLILFLIILISLDVNGQTKSHVTISNNWSEPSPIKLVDYHGYVIDRATECNLKVLVLSMLLNDSIKLERVVPTCRYDYIEDINFSIKKELLSKDEIIYLFESGWGMSGEFMTTSYSIRIGSDESWEVDGNYPKIKFKCEMRCVE